MAAIGQRSFAEIANSSFDVIVIGGGIQGAMIHMEASRDGLRSLLVEKHDFGGETTHNTLRIVHGGLRYLQSLDVVRCWESSGERQWFLHRMGAQVTPMSCLIPLYGKGMKRRSVLRVALRLNALIAAAARRVNGFDLDSTDWRVLGRDEALRALPFLHASRLQGAALWYDLQMRCPARIVMEVLHDARRYGGEAANYVEALELLTTRNKVRGVKVQDVETGEGFELVAPIVVNAAGPAVRRLARRWDRDLPRLFHPSVAWNLLLDRPAPSRHALALTDDRKSDATAYFLTPLHGRLFVGTGHAPLREADEPRWRSVVDSHLDGFLESVNHVVPGLCVTRRDIVRVFCGMLPATRAGTAELRVRDVIEDHGRTGGPDGLYSVSGIKFTTSRALARKLLKRILAASSPALMTRRTATAAATAFVSPGGACGETPWSIDPIDPVAFERFIRTEAVVHLDDLVLRRTALGDDPPRALEVAQRLSDAIPAWRGRREEELDRVTAALGARRIALQESGVVRQ